MKLRNGFLVLSFAIICSTHAQQPVEAFSATYIATSTPVDAYEQTPAPASGTFINCAQGRFRYHYNQGNRNALKLLSIIAGGRNFFINRQNAIIKLRRVDNAAVTGNRSIVFLESVAIPSGCPAIARFDFKSAYQDEMETFLNANYMNQGTDNIFTNTANGDGNNNNIERVDVIFPSGLSSASAQEAGFALFDRGVNGAHDGFRICAITQLDAQGNPAGFGTVVSCTRGNGTQNGSWGHPSMSNGNTNLDVYVLRKEAAETQLRSSAAINQQIGGVFFSFADLGINNHQTIYGYALLGPDGLPNPSSSQLLNINDTAVYPLNTTEAMGGGLDLIAVSAGFSTGGHTLPVHISSFRAIENSGTLYFDWGLENIPTYSLLQLEASADGNHFSTLRTFQGHEVLASMKHKQPVSPSFAFYRLKWTTGNGVVFSRTIKTDNHATVVITVTPTFFTADQPLEVKGLPDGTFAAQWITTDGRVYNASFTSAGGRAMLRSQVKYSRGVVFLLIINSRGEIVKEQKLVMY